MLEFVYTAPNQRRNSYVDPAYLLGTNLPVANTTVTTVLTITPTDTMPSGSTTSAAERYEGLLNGWYKPTQLAVQVPDITTTRPGTITVLQTLNDGTDYDIVVGSRWLATAINGWYELPLLLQLWDTTSETAQALRLKVQTSLPADAVVSADVNGVTALSLYLQQ